MYYLNDRARADLRRMHTDEFGDDQTGDDAARDYNSAVLAAIEACPAEFDFDGDLGFDGMDESEIARWAPEYVVALVAEYHMGTGWTRMLERDWAGLPEGTE